MSSEYPVLTPQQREERKAKIIRQTQMDGLKASLVTTAAVFALHYGAKKYWPRWKRFPLSPRIFWLSSAVVATYVIVAEKSHLKYLSEIQDYDARALQELDDAKLYSNLPRVTATDGNANPTESKVLQ